MSKINTLQDNNGLDFSVFLKDVQKTFLKNVERYGTAIYRTYGGSLKKSPYNQIYLEGVQSPVDRQKHNCSCCRHWLQKYADLVFITEEGKTVSAFWNPDDILIPEYVGSVWRMKEKAETSLVTAPWIGSETTIGIEESGGFNHFHFMIPRFFMDRIGKVSKAGAASGVSELIHDYQGLERALEDYSLQVLTTASAVANAPGVFPNQAQLGKRAQFLLEVAQKAGEIKHFFHRKNYILLRATTAPAGWARPTSNLLGEFLDHLKRLIEESKDGQIDVQHTIGWINKLLDPLKYRRTEADALRKGNIDLAEKIMKELGFDRQLSFEMAKLSDIPVKIWEPTVSKEESQDASEFSMFSQLHKNVEEKAQPSIKVNLNYGNITFMRFKGVVLPHAVSMKVKTSSYAMNLRHYFKMTSETPGIWSHDTVDEDRLPISSFLFASGTRPEVIRLPSNAWVGVVAIIPHQSMMKPGRVPNPTEIFTFILEGKTAVDHDSVGLFPTELRRELRTVENVIEALGNGLPLPGHEENGAVGVDVVRGMNFPAIDVEVFDGVARTKYRIDRFE